MLVAVRDTGIPITSYQRIESGDYDRVPYSQLMNCALVLEVELDELIEDRFRIWTTFDGAVTTGSSSIGWPHRKHPVPGAG